MFGRKKIKVSEWASVMNKKEYPLFMQAVEDYFRQKGEPYIIADGIVKLEENDFEFGLNNLMQMCAKSRPEDYDGIISFHFGQLIESKKFETQFKEISGDFEKVKQYLAVRLYDKEYIECIGEDIFVRRHFAGELYAALVWDFPAAIQNVLKDDIEKWGKTEDELFVIGMENVRNNYEMKTEEVDIDEDFIYGINYEHFFVPNILFDLDKHPEFIGKGGTIVAVPTRNMAMIYPIRDMKVVNALNKFFWNVPNFYSEGPGSLTKEIYWYHNGQFEVLEFEIEKENVKFTPSQAFMDLLNNMSETEL